jgi:DNA uptake protein ComE-like DNA-binding protein
MRRSGDSNKEHLISRGRWPPFGGCITRLTTDAAILGGRKQVMSLWARAGTMVLPVLHNPISATPSLLLFNSRRVNLDINKASAEELKEAFQVDGTRAGYIVQKREELGGFESWDQFKKVVPGFEDKMVENLEQAGLSIGERTSHGSGSHGHEARPDGEPASSHHDKSHSSRDSARKSVDINRASRDQLERAFQVDGQRAEYIVQKRQELGGFKSWEQFKQVVPGFEDQMVENLEEAGFTLGDKRKAA